MTTNKPILDATCGGRMMWFDKQNPACLYLDGRKVDGVELCDGRMFSVRPDIVADFTALPFADNTFYHVVFDPPHLLHAGNESYMAIKYGTLPADWKPLIRAGFNECMRVLKPYGTLIFKWSEDQVKLRDVLDAIGQKPMYGHPNGHKRFTHWMAFMKGVSDE